MRCAFSWITCSAPAVSCRAGGDIACAVEAPGAVRLLIGDVMGHGPRAAQTAAEVTRAFRALAAGPDPLQVVAMRLHDLVVARAADEEFVTAQLVSVPLEDRAEPAIVCCGHPPPLLLRHGRAIRPGPDGSAPGPGTASCCIPTGSPRRGTSPDARTRCSGAPPCWRR